MNKNISVAQHSVLVSRMSESSPRAGLLHDAHEALIGDIPSPVKAAMEEMCPRAWHEFERHISDKVRHRFGCPQVMPPDVKTADLVCREMEVYHCSGNGDRYYRLGVVPQRGPKDVWDGVVWPAEHARKEFLINARLLGIY